MLAGLKLPPDWNWAAVRAEVQIKERYFDVLAGQRGVDGGPDGGRSELGEEASRRIDTIRQKCPDDFDAMSRCKASVMRVAEPKDRRVASRDRRGRLRSAQQSPHPFRRL